MIYLSRSGFTRERQCDCEELSDVEVVSFLPIFERQSGRCGYACLVFTSAAMIACIIVRLEGSISDRELFEE